MGNCHRRVGGLATGCLERTGQEMMGGAGELVQEIGKWQNRRRPSKSIGEQGIGADLRPRIACYGRRFRDLDCLSSHVSLDDMYKAAGLYRETMEYVSPSTTRRTTRRTTIASWTDGPMCSTGPGSAKCARICLRRLTLRLAQGSARSANPGLR